MGLILVFAVILIVGVGLVIIDGDYTYGTGLVMAFAGGLSLLIAVIAVIAIQADQPRGLAGYEQDKAYIEASMANDSLTDTERSKVMDLMLDDNLAITTSRTYRDNFFLGWFHGYELGSLRLFDFKEMQKAKLQVDLVREK